MRKVRKAIIPAAGLGTRFLPATKAQPKEMLPIVDKPTIQYIIEEAIESGIEDIIIVTGRNKRAIEDHFDKSIELEVSLANGKKDSLLKIVHEITNLVDIHYIRQKEPKGLGHAIWCARKFIGNEPFAVLLGDDIVVSQKPCLKQLIEQYEERKGSIVGVQEVPLEDVSKYGIVSIEKQKGRVHPVNSLIEKPPTHEAPSRLAVMGRYIIEPEIFSILDFQKPGSGGEIQITDALNQLNMLKPIYAYEFLGKRFDVGDKLGYLQATVEFALRRNDLGEEFRSYLESLMLTDLSKDEIAVG